jgi:polyisoprenyl-phosphate glycosyltransferase
MNKKKITISIPCYNEEENVDIAFKEILKITNKIKKYDFEYIFIDNGSTDKTANKIRSLTKKSKNVVGVFLSRNFGAEASGQAGYDFSTGDAVIGLPCDLQDPPSLIPKFINKWEKGYQIVLGSYKKAPDDLIIRLMRKAFYKIYRIVSHTDISINVSGVGLFDRKVINALKKLPEKYRFGRGLVAWLGYKKTYIVYERKKRERGISSYSFIDYIKAAERGLFGFSYLILDIMAYIGFILVLFSILFIVGYLFTVLFIGNPIKASIPLMLAIVFFGGINLLAISIIGKYIQVIVEETKNRPTYIVEETINIKDN